MKTEADKLLLVLRTKRIFPINFAKIEFFSIYKPQVVYLRPFVSSQPFPKFSKQNYMYFGYKHVET